MSLSYLQAANITDTFKKQVINQPSLATSVYSETTLGSFISYTHNSALRNRRNKWYYMASLDLSGNIARQRAAAKWVELQCLNSMAQYASILLTSAAGSGT